MINEYTSVYFCHFYKGCSFFDLSFVPWMKYLFQNGVHLKLATKESTFFLQELTPIGENVSIHFRGKKLNIAHTVNMKQAAQEQSGPIISTTN